MPNWKIPPSNCPIWNSDDLKGATVLNLYDWKNYCHNTLVREKKSSQLSPW